MTCDYTYIDHLNDTETTLTKPVTVTIYTDSDAKYLNLYINDEEINASLTVGGAFKQISPNEITCDYKYVETHNIYQCTLTLRLNGESIVDYTRTSSYPPQNYENRHYLRGHKIN